MFGFRNQQRHNMIKCSTCAEKFTRGKLCVDCGQAYCEKEILSKCPFCKSKLMVAKVIDEELDKNIIQWLTLGDLQIGLVDFEQAPPHVLRVLYSSGSKSTGKHRLVLFPSKRSSWKITNCFRKKFSLPIVEYDDFFEQSRYALLEEPDTKKRYILLNMRAVNHNTLEFLVVFLSNLFSRMEKFREADNEIAVESLGKALFSHNAKLGIPFITGDEATREYFEILEETLPGIYTEYVVLKELCKDYLKEIPSFLEHKIKLLFSGIEYERLAFLRGVYDILNVFFQLSSFLALAQEHESLKHYVNNIFSPRNEAVKGRLKENFSDVSKCLDLIIQEFSQKGVYKSYESYLRNFSKSIEEIFGILRPKYLRISEIGSLFRICKEYETKIEIGEKPYIPEFGSVEKFSGLLLKLFRREDLYPELRVIAGQLLQGILNFRVWKENNYLAYLEGLELVEELSQLIIDNIPAITERLSNVEHEYGTIGYHDACLALTSFSQFCYVMNDTDSALKLINLSKNIAQKHDVLPIKITHAWKDFTNTHNYDRLLDVSSLFSAVDYVEHRYLEEHIKTIGHLARGIFRKEAKKDEFDKAENHALAMMELKSPAENLMSYSAHAIQSSKARYHLVHLFRHILDACEADISASLKKAWLEAQAMSASIAAIDPLNKFTLKTEILFFLVAGNVTRTLKACNRLKNQSSKAPSIKRFANNIESWLLESEKLRGRRFVLGINISESDPWERLFRRIVYTKMKDDLDRHIVSRDAVVFVEGVSDAEILQQFARKLVPNKKILFMDAEGFTNMNYYSEARIAQRFRVPVYVLFDGDTSTVQRKNLIKEKLVGQITLPEDHVLTLEKNSIEDYLLVPTAIKRAFVSISATKEDINTFFRRKRTKRNKKAVLSELFDRLSVGKYDYEKATIIASKMELSEIDAEIRRIFSLF